MTRKVDLLGRIVLPVDMRQQLGIRPEDELEITLEEGAIRLRKAGRACLRCAGSEELVDIAPGYCLCARCLAQWQNRAKE